MKKSPEPKGKTFNKKIDGDRLKTQYERVLALMEDAKWRTLRDISDRVIGSEAGVSARLRDLRKIGHVVERRRKAGGLYEYRLLIQEPAE